MSLRFYPLWVIHLSQSVLVLCVSSQTVCLAPHSPSLTTADCVLAKLRSTAIWRMHDVQITVGLSRGGVSNWKTWNLSYPRSMWHKVGQSWTSCQCWSNAQTEAIKRLEWLCYSLWFRIVFFFNVWTRRVVSPPKVWMETPNMLHVGFRVCHTSLIFPVSNTCTEYENVSGCLIEWLLISEVDMHARRHTEVGLLASVLFSSKGRYGPGVIEAVAVSSVGFWAVNVLPVPW